VARERVVSDFGVRLTHGVRDLAIGDHLTGSGGEGVQEDVLARSESHLAPTLADASVQSVDLKIGNHDRRHRGVPQTQLRPHATSIDPRGKGRMTIPSCSGREPSVASGETGVDEHEDEWHG
jgi:hypothetical protein